LPEVSVVIPTHNRSSLLSVTLKSVLQQTGVDLEAIVVDDGSAEDVSAVVDRFQDDRIHLVRNDAAEGVSAARNRGIERARAEWVGFVDDDDLWAPDKLRLQLDAIRRSGRCWAYGGAVKIDLRGQVIGGAPPPEPDEVARRLASWNLIPGGCSNVIVGRSALRTTGGFDRSLVNLADWDLWIRIGKEGPPAMISAPLVAYRIHPSSSSTNLSLILSEVDRLDGRYGVALDRGAIHHYLAWVALRSGDRRSGLTHFLHAAAGGDALAVARALGSLLRGRAERTLPGVVMPSRRERADRRWRAPAEAWLADLA
jgi:glycosyltransferase involved in cell wall biosynthesis